jgi:hypothetical protein
MMDHGCCAMLCDFQWWFTNDYLNANSFVFFSVAIKRSVYMDMVFTDLKDPKKRHLNKSSNRYVCTMH